MDIQQIKAVLFAGIKRIHRSYPDAYILDCIQTFSLPYALEQLKARQIRDWIRFKDDVVFATIGYMAENPPPPGS
jgi:hypothetical protein